MKQANRAVKLIFQKELTIASVESCTGGMIASELVGYSGISDNFREGYVTYSNEAKVRNLGVKPETLDAYGAVSEQTAAEMALGVQRRANADIGIATTGIAGPTGGTPEKPVGLVFIGCAYKGKILVRRFLFDGNRYQVRLAATRQAFSLIADTLARSEALRDGNP